MASSLSFEFIEYDDCPIPVKDIKNNITTQLADYFLQDKQPEKSILIALENVSDYLSAALSQNVRHGENESISVKNIANVSYGPLPENNNELVEASRSEKGIFLQRFNVSGASSKQKREVVLSVFIFTVYEFSLSQMLPYYPSGRTEGDSFWHPPNYTDFYPSAAAPYLSVQLVTDSGSSIDSSVDFEVDMSADTTVDNVARPYLFSIYQLWHTILETGYRCLIMDPAKKMFVSDGCSETVVGNRVTCSCQKLGLFTIVPRVVAQVRPQGLDVIFHVFLAISVIALIFTLVALNNFNKRVKNERIVVQMNLVLSLMLFLFVLLIERVSVRGKSSCVVSALFTHFFMLSTEFFLLIEGITIHTNMHSRALKLKRRNRQRVFRIQLVAGWVIPLLIAIMTIALGFPLNTYLESGQFGYNRCWFPANTAILIATVIVPIASIFICTFSLALLTTALIVKRRITPLNVMQRSRDYDNMTIDDVDMDHVIRMWLEHFLVGVVLILPWALFFMPGYNSLVANLQNIYTAFVFMAIQGILVFIIYVIVSRDVRTAMFGTNKYSSTYSLYWYGPEQSGDDLPIENYTVYTRDNLDEIDEHGIPEDEELRRTSRQQTPLEQQKQHVEQEGHVERIQLKKVERLQQAEEQEEQDDENQRIEKITLVEKLARLEQQKEQKEKEGDKEQADEMELLEKLAWLEQREKHAKPEEQTQENENNELMEKLARLEQREDTDHQGTPWEKMELTDEVRHQRELQKMKQLVPLEKRKQQKDQEQPIEKVKLKKVERPEKRTEEDQDEQHKDKGDLLKKLAQLEQPEKQTEQVENLELLEKFAQKKQWKGPLEYPKVKEEEVEEPLEEMDLQGKIAWLEERERRMSNRSK
uniref:Adhesion G-protein coupled receptor D1-like n=1 Tax=Phallusia mammillata TaxID=59560 RepID=A0A6F9D6N5_9ASCI|nr:adhesion G-protein coupled receptor D1-like [Phallusia mammillata]